MRTSSGFLVTGTSGNTRIQILPPRFTKRVMARRAASISRAVRRPRAMAFKPNSPNATVLPFCARPRLRPLCCLRNLVRLGCIMDMIAYSSVGRGRDGLIAGRGRVLRRVQFVRVQDLALEDPYLYADHTVGGGSLGEAVVDVGPQGVQRHAALAVPLAARDLGAIQAARDAHLDA